MTIHNSLPAMIVCLTGFAAAAFGGEPLRFDFSASPLELKTAEIEKSRQFVQAPRCAQSPTVDGTYVTPHEVDPIAMPVEEKIGLLLRAEGAMQGTPKVRITQAFLTVLRKRTLFANSEGSRYDQTIYECGGGIAATRQPFCWRMSSGITWQRVITGRL